MKPCDRTIAYYQQSGDVREALTWWDGRRIYQPSWTRQRAKTIS